MRRPLAAATLTAAALITAFATVPGAANASSADRTHRVFMNGSQEVPGPGDHNGVGVFTYQVKGAELCYTITARHIKPATAAHIHKGKKGVAGPIVVTLKTPADGSAKGCIKAVKEENKKDAALVLTQSELHGIVDSPQRYYANVHNEKFPMGAIRGQL
ncbi:CHRD domain-containing protein [Nonomuraea guangzhouensis]|uniref:CHRD domain-containing protein n=1 Tax=Nonomuraea guangzhouensis TaxID=1291555 RepID=A0ABW4G3Z6_9ACTN|nr:CHRD domain-containing protein [Nonomuraea guangzhouensis]